MHKLKEDGAHRPLFDYAPSNKAHGLGMIYLPTLLNNDKIK